MDKIIYCDDYQDGLLEKCGGAMSTLIERESHIKSASSDAISEKLIRDHLPDDKHFAVHHIAMGSEEGYGFNKNGDSFPDAALEKYHPTFVKFGYYFREHINRDPKKKIGLIKASAFNKPMRRCELIVWGDKEKAAAEYEHLKKGKDLDGSMSCKVPDDECSCCGKRAKNSKNYCTCLKKGITQYNEKYSKFAFARNHEPTFFDFSSVKNRADRIARHLEVRFHDDKDEMSKSAGVNDFLFSDDLATEAGILLPVPAGLHDPRKQRILTKLAACEEYLANLNKAAHDYRKDLIEFAAPYAFHNDDFTDEHLTAFRSVDPSVLFRGMAAKSAAMSFPVFFAYVRNQSLKQASENPELTYIQTNLLPTLFRTALTEPHGRTEDLFEPSSSLKFAKSDDIDLQKATKAAQSAWAIDPSNLRSRALRYAGSKPLLKSASATAVSLEPKQIQEAKSLASAYAMYKVAFCETLADLACEEVIDEPTLLLLTYQHLN